MYIPEKVPADETRNALKGVVNERTAGYLRMAAKRPTPPAARPMMPPMLPPLTVAL